MYKVNIKKYIYTNKIKSTLFLIRTTKTKTISDESKNVIRTVRHGVSNVRFALFRDHIPEIKDYFDLIIADCTVNQLSKIKKDFKYNHILIVEHGAVYYTGEKTHKLPIKSVPLEMNHDLNRMVELRRLRKRQTIGQLAGKKTGLYVGVAATSLVLLFPSLIMSTHLAQYLPQSILPLQVDNNKAAIISKSGKYSALTYNTGFAAYNQDMHFYMDAPGQSIIGGQGTAESKEAVEKSMAGIVRILSPEHDAIKFTDPSTKTPAADVKGTTIFTTTYNNGQRPTDSSDARVPNTLLDISNLNQNLNSAQDGLFDFIALQEQDVVCPKTYNTDQYQMTKDATITYKDGMEYKISDLYNSSIAYNFATPFIPIPLNDMFGKTHTGLGTYSRYYVESSTRNSLPNIKTFPLNMFELKRGYTVNTYPIKDTSGKLVSQKFHFINAHLAAYDSGGNIRREQLQHLNELLQGYVKNNDYFIIAADWNQILPDTRGYEGYNALCTDEEKETTYKDDKPNAGWDYEEFKLSGNHARPDMENDFIKVPDYEENKQYKAGDAVWFNAADYGINDPTEDFPANNDGWVERYMSSRTNHEYQAINDTNEKPLNADGTLNKNWEYYLSNSAVYKDASINEKVRHDLLSVAYGSDPKAKFYTTHAIPTLRNAGEAYNSEILKWTQYPGRCYKASIDGFLVSSNLNVTMSYGFDTRYAYSDHNPVAISFTFKN